MSAQKTSDEAIKKRNSRDQIEKIPRSNRTDLTHCHGICKVPTITKKQAFHEKQQDIMGNRAAVANLSKEALL
jgi:hypothetical protein